LIGEAAAPLHRNPNGPELHVSDTRAEHPALGRRDHQSSRPG
jgi:hypothetical protein